MDRCSNKRGRSNEDKSVRVEGDHGSTNIMDGRTVIS